MRVDRVCSYQTFRKIAKFFKLEKYGDKREGYNGMTAVALIANQR
jgi:hypothetical protein